jgi:hypothetical protein
LHIFIIIILYLHLLWDLQKRKGTDRHAADILGRYYVWRILKKPSSIMIRGFLPE